MIDKNSTKEEVLEAVKQNGRALEYASWELRNDREVVTESVKHDGYALEYASEYLRGDREVVLAAVRQDGTVLRFAGFDLIYEVAECWQDAIKKGLIN